MIKRLSLIVLSLVLVFSLAACSSMESDSSYDEIGSASGSIDSVNKNDGFVSEMSPSVSDSESTSSNTQNYLDTQKLIYSCNMVIQTKEFNDSLAAIKEKIADYDGFVEQETVRDDSYGWYNSSYTKNSGTLSASITVRIPTTNYNKFVEEAGNIGKVMKKTEDVENITKQYNDTAIIIAELEKEQELLLSMMDRCNTIQDMMTVESRLSEVTQKLARYNSTMNEMDVDIAFSTINIELEEVVEYRTEPVVNPTFIERVVAAVKESIKLFGNFVSDLIIFLIFLAPYLVIALIVFLLWLRFGKKSPKRTRNAVAKIEDMNRTQPIEPTQIEEEKNADN